MKDFDTHIKCILLQSESNYKIGNNMCSNVWMCLFIAIYMMLHDYNKPQSCGCVLMSDDLKYLIVT